MRRAPIVVVATIAGLAGVLTFHTKSAGIISRGLPQTSATTRPPSTSTTAGSSTGKSSVATGPPGSTTPTTVPTTAHPIHHGALDHGRATGSLVNYNYGVLSVSVTVTGKKVTNVGIASLDDGGNFRSQSIDQQSIPILEQQALQAQSANIQGVSGASYTSAGFEQSLQAALSKLGL